MKTILYIYHTSSIGGGSFCLLNILKSIDRRMVRPVVLLKEDGPLVAEIKDLDIPIYFLPTLSTVPYNVSTFTPKKLINAIRLISSFSNYKKLLNEINPDVVYINTMMLYPYLCHAKEKDIKTIIHIREHWPDGEHPWQRKTALEYIDKYADHIVAINTYSKSIFDFSKKPKTVIYDWIDLSSRYKEIPLSTIFNEDMSDKKVYLYLGGMQAIKGSYEVLSTFSRVIRDPKSRLLAMGFCEQGYNNGFKAKLRKLLLRFGYKSYAEKVMELIDKDKRIKCIPSEYMINHIIQQAYCVLSFFTIPHANLALAESIILGTPSIAADTEEAREYSCNGDLAFLYKMNSIKDFEKTIKEVVSKRDEILKRISERSNEISEMFSPQQNMAKLNRLCSNI